MIEVADLNPLSSEKGDAHSSSKCEPRPPRYTILTEPTPAVRPWSRERVFMSSRPEDSHLRALPDPYVNLSIHTARDVRAVGIEIAIEVVDGYFAKTTPAHTTR